MAETSAPRMREAAPHAAANASVLTGSAKAAAFLLAIGEEASSKILENLDVDEVKQLSHAMATLGKITPDQVENIFVDFKEQLVGAHGLRGSLDATERMLMRVMPGSKVASIMEEIRGPAGRTMWEKLSNVNEETLANYLKGEYPQTVAVVLSKVRPDHAAKVLALLPEIEAVDIMQRILAMESVQKDVLEDVEKTLETEFLAALARTSRTDPHEQLAQIFNALDRSTEQRLMLQLEDRNRDSAERIKSLMFTFDDLTVLDNAGVQTLLRNIDKGDLALALKGGSEKFREMVISNMAERAAKIFKEDMANLGPVRLKEVDAAQGRIVGIAKQLADSGEITISMGDDDEMVF